MFKAILFDFDGTLLDSDQMIFEAFKILYQKYKPEVDADFSHTLTFSGPPILETLQKEFPKQNIDKIYHDYLKITPPLYQKYVRLYDGVIPLLNALKKRGIKLALVTSKRRIHTEMTLKQHHLENLFDVTVTPDEVKCNKPSPDGLNFALNVLGVSIDEALYVGDSEYDALAAKNAKMKFALVGWSPRKDKITIQPDYLIKQFSSFIEDLNLS